MSESKETTDDCIGIQYLGGLEPDSRKRIDQAVYEFKFKTKFKDENTVVVSEVDKYSKSHEKKLLAHRYRVSFILGDERVNWPSKHGEYLTETGVINFFRNLAPLWNLLRDYRVKQAIEKKKRIGQLNRVAAVSEQAISKW